MDSWTPRSDPRNPPARTDCTSGPGNHRPWERTHWSITRSRYALTTGRLCPLHQRAAEHTGQLNIWAESWGAGLRGEDLKQLGLKDTPYLVLYISWMGVKSTWLQVESKYIYWQEILIIVYGNPSCAIMGLLLVNYYSIIVLLWHRIG